MSKQRRESIEQYRSAAREDLVEQEAFELNILQHYLPAALSDEEVDSLIESAIGDCGASSMKDMGKVMGMVKPQVVGKADMGAVSQKIKARLG